MFKFCLTILACLVSGSFAWSQNILWTKEYYGGLDSLFRSSQSPSAMLSGARLFHTIRYSACDMCMTNGYKFFSINPNNPNISDSSVLISGVYFPSLAIDDNSLYTYRKGNGNVNVLALEKNFQIQASYNVSSDFWSEFKLFRKGNLLELFGTSHSTKNHILYKFDSLLNLVDSTVIPFSLFTALNSSITSVPSPSYRLFYSPISKKYWFSNIFNQFVLDSNLVPQEYIRLQTYDPSRGDANLQLNMLTSFKQIELPSYAILSTGRGRLSGISTPREDFFRITKWNCNYEIVDSVEFFTQKGDTILDIAGSGISWLNNVNEIYVVGNLTNLLTNQSQAIVSKIDTSLYIHWTKSINHPSGHFMSFGIEAVPGNGAIIYGAANYIPGTSTLNSIGYLVRIDSTGAVLSSSDPQMQVEKDFLCYPNPAKNDLYFSVQHDSKPIDVQIFDALGALVYQEKNVKQTRLSLEGWSTGLYTYRVRCEDRISTGKFVKE